MSYLNDPREGRFGEDGQLWEMDNRVETRYYWNGQFLDLCNMTPEEYSKCNPCLGGGGNGNCDCDEDNTKSKNVIEPVVEGDIDDTNNYYISLTASYPVATAQKINVIYTYQDEDGNEQTNEETVELTSGSMVLEKTSCIGPLAFYPYSIQLFFLSGEKKNSDDAYNYEVVDKEGTVDDEDKDIQIFWGVYPTTATTEYSVKATVNPLKNPSGLTAESIYKYGVSFTLPQSPEKIVSQEIADRNCYDLAIIIPEEYEGKLSVEDEFGPEPDFWKKIDLRPTDYPNHVIYLCYNDENNSQIASDMEEIEFEKSITIEE